MSSSVGREVCRIGEAVDDCVSNTTEVGTRESKEHEDDKETVGSGGSHGPNAVVEDTKLFRGGRERCRRGVMDRESFLNKLDLGDGALAAMAALERRPHLKACPAIFGKGKFYRRAMSKNECADHCVINFPVRVCPGFDLGIRLRYLTEEIEV